MIKQILTEEELKNKVNEIRNEDNFNKLITEYADVYDRLYNIPVPELSEDNNPLKASNNPVILSDEILEECQKEMDMNSLLLKEYTAAIKFFLSQENKLTEEEGDIIWEYAYYKKSDNGIKEVLKEYEDASKLYKALLKIQYK